MPDQTIDDELERYGMASALLGSYEQVYGIYQRDKRPRKMKEAQARIDMYEAESKQLAESLNRRLTPDASQIETAVREAVYRELADAELLTVINGHIVDAITQAVLDVIGRGEPLEKIEQLPDRADVKETE